MANRRTNSPWGSSYKEGLPSTAVNSSVDVDQNVRATISTGVIDVATGQWQGIRLSDEQFLIDATHEAVANGASVLSPQSQPNHIDMTGYSDLFIAIKNSSGSTFGVEAVMGPSTTYFANLEPVNAGAILRGTTVTTPTAMVSALIDSNESLTDSVWNIFSIQTVLANQKNLQFKITNSSGGNSDIQFAYLRVV